MQVGGATSSDAEERASELSLDVQSHGSAAHAMDARGCIGAMLTGLSAGTLEARGTAESSGAPADTEAGVGIALHPDAVAFNSAMWACLGDPMDALSALGA